VGKILHRYDPTTNLRIEHVPDRPAHDRRYSLDSSKIRNELGWRPAYSFESSLQETVKWYVDNKWWWEPLLNSNVLDMQPWTREWKR
jgi:dTDP-glucose 4,6-dehydratase